MKNTQGGQVNEAFSKQDKNCKIIYTVFGCILGLFLLWLIGLSVMKSLRGEQGERGPPGPTGPEGATGPAGATSDAEMKNAKIFSITKDTDFSSSTEVKARSGFILENGVKSDMTITLPHFSVIGNGAMFYIFNQSPVYTLSIKAAKVTGQKPAQMSFTSGARLLILPPGEFVTIIIMAQQYAIFTEEEKNNKPILHWVNSWNNCGGIPKKFVKIPSDEGFIVGPSLQTWGCKNYRKYMDVVQIGSVVKNANTIGKNPSDVEPGGIFVVENPNRKPINNLNSQKEVTINSKGPLNIQSKGAVVMNLPRNRTMDARGARIKSGLTDKEAQCYLNRYSDLRKAFGANNIKAAKNHWLRHGIREKRTYACPNEKKGLLGGIKIGGGKKPKKKVGMLGLVKKKKKAIKYALVYIGGSPFFLHKKNVRTPFQIKKIFKPLLNSGNKKFLVFRFTKCGITVKRVDKMGGWGDKLVVKVQYKIKNGKNIKKYCNKFSDKGLKRIQKNNKKWQKKLNMRLE